MTANHPKAKVAPTGQGKRLASILTPSNAPRMSHSATKVIFTIGPSCQDVDVLSRILEEGGTCGRVDLTWGSLAFHRKSLKNLSQAMLRTKRMCSVMLDTLGREVFVRRTIEIGPNGWPKHDKEIDVPKGSTITLTVAKNATQTGLVFPVNYENLPKMVLVGDQLYVGRYLVTGADAASLYLEVKSKTDTEVKCTALNDAKLQGLLTVYHMERTKASVSNMQNTQPLFAPYDLEALRMLLAEFKVDFLSLSYTRTAADVAEAREVLSGFGSDHVKIIAKLDARQSLVNFRGILNSADGVMISRGNLGLDCLPEKVAVIQKNITTSCNLLGKPCVVTRILDTMVNAPRPTRAEATDVANAVLDGADCLMLGAETLRGSDPANAVRTVVRCCLAAEEEFNYLEHFDYLMREAMKAERVGIAVPGGEDSPDGSAHGGNQAMSALGPGKEEGMTSSVSQMNLSRALRAMTRNNYGAPPPHSASVMSLRGVVSEDSGRSQMSFLAKLEAIASSAVRAAAKANARLIIVFTDTGLTAALVAKYRPSVPILTLVVPRLVNQNMKWKVLGGHVARQALIVRGLVPMLAESCPDGEQVLRDAILAASTRGLVRAGDNVVCVEKISGDYCIKMVSVDDSGRDLKRNRVLVNTLTKTPRMAMRDDEAY